MRPALIGLAVLAAMHAVPARAEQPVFEDLPLLDLDTVAKEMADDMFGHWTIRDKTGTRACGVELEREATIGGMQIDVDPACETVFPVMADITAWRLLQGWTIDLADAERKTRIRFTTPDDSYVAYPEVDGIFTIEPEPVD